MNDAPSDRRAHFNVLEENCVTLGPLWAVGVS